MSDRGSTRVRIVADDAIAWLQEAFAGFGEIVAVPGRQITRGLLHDADVLLTRSVTLVDAALLDGTTVRFVGSCTAGVDHVDLEALRQPGITFAHAPGCNARAVAEYVITALSVLRRDETNEREHVVALIGFGEVGRRLTVLLRALGYGVRVCDPPLAERLASGDVGTPTHATLALDEAYFDLEAAVAGASVLTLHVPLSTTGRHCTAHLVDASVLQRLDEDAIVINTSRGGVVDDAALQAWLHRGRGRAIVDVWEREPVLRPDLVEAVALATPHVAGYTLEGKAAATAMVHGALARWLGVPPTFDPSSVLGPPGAEVLVVDLHGAGAPAEALARCLLAANPLDRDDVALRNIMTRPAPERAAAFEALRRAYRFRRELAHVRLERAVRAGLPPNVVSALATLGVQLP